MFEHWQTADLCGYAKQLIDDARCFEKRLSQNQLPSVFSRTESHIVLVDVGSVGLTGRQAEDRLDSFKVLVNRNTVPGDTQPGWIGSGVRFGTSVLTILGYSPQDIKNLADVIASILHGQGDPSHEIERLLTKYQKNTSMIVDNS